MRLTLFLVIELLCLWGTLAYVIAALRSTEYVLLWPIPAVVFLSIAGILYYVQPGSALFPVLVIGSGFWGMIIDRRIRSILSQHRWTALDILLFRAQ